MLRVTKAKHRLFQESCQRDQLLRSLQLQILHSKAFMYCRKVDLRAATAAKLCNIESTDFHLEPNNEGRTAAGPCPSNAQQVPANWASLQNSNEEAQPTLHMSFHSMNSQKRNHHKMKNNQSTPPTQGAVNCHVYVAPNDELELHINDEDWDIVMGPLV
ncbi:hypothetical protein MRX96_057704 [Rhipicephalus microplus]